MRARFEQGVPPLRTVDETVPEPLESIVMRCLERDPAARFQTTGELTAALAAIDDAGDLIPVPARISKRVLAAALVVVLALVGGTYFAGRRANAPAAVHPPVSVLIADFDNRANDPSFNGALENALGLGIEGASFVNAFDRGDAQKLAEQYKPGGRVDEQIARLISVREGISLIVSGSIESQGAGYLLSAKLTDTAHMIDDPEPAAPTVLTAKAASKADVLRAVASLAGAGADDAWRYDAGAAAPGGGRDLHGGVARRHPQLRAGPGFRQQRQGRAGGGVLPPGDRAGSELRARVRGAGLEQRAPGTAGRIGRALEESAGAPRPDDRAREVPDARASTTARSPTTTRMAIETYKELVNQFPADATGYNNLAVAYFATRNFPKAFEAGRRARRALAQRERYQTNYASLRHVLRRLRRSGRAGGSDCQGHPDATYAYLPLAVAALAGGKPDAARDAYQRMATTGTVGASLAEHGPRRPGDLSGPLRRRRTRC